MYDEAFARVNLGTLGANREVFQAKLCFKGKAVYDVNMLQVNHELTLESQTEVEKFGSTTYMLESFREQINTLKFSN